MPILCDFTHANTLLVVTAHHSNTKEKVLHIKSIKYNAIYNAMGKSCVRLRWYFEHIDEGVGFSDVSGTSDRFLMQTLIFLIMHQVRGFIVQYTAFVLWSSISYPSKIAIATEISLTESILNQIKIKSNLDLVNRNQIISGNQWRYVALLGKIGWINSG